MASEGQGLVGAIKDLLKEELKELYEDLSKRDQRQEDTTKALQELSGKIVDQEQQANKLSESLEQLKKDLEDKSGQTQAQLGEDITSLKERVTRCEDDENGMGGLKQVHEKCTTLEKAFGDIMPKFEDSMRLVKDNNTRTEEFDRKLRELSRQCEEIVETLKASEERVTKMEGITSTVSMAQEALDDSVARKYEKLWEDVLHAIEEVKGTQVDVMKRDWQTSLEASKAETRSLVNYALNFMASAHGERRQNALNKSLLAAWKEQTWNSARRRLGISYLHKILQRRHRTVFDTWHRRHCTSVLCDRLHGQYTGQLSDVYREIKEGDAGLKSRCDKLDGEVTILQDEKCSKKSLNDSIQKLRDLINDELKALVPIKATLKEHGDVQKRHDEQHRNHFDSEAILDAKILGLGRDLADVIEGCKEYAKNEEVKGMIRDILLIWNSIKQLDTAKADKKDVDSFALETGNRDKLSVRRLEDLEADLASKSRQDTLRVQEKWSELEGRLDESGRQFRHWEQMWEKLSGFVEDLVAKIGDLQGGDKLPSTTLRLPGREIKTSRSRADIPTLPTHNGAGGRGGHDDAAATRPTMDRGAHQHAEGLDTKKLWLDSAKGIVDATIDQAVNAVTPTSARPRSRPKSATSRPESVSRRPHDRAR